MKSCSLLMKIRLIYESSYSRIDQVTFIEDSLSWSILEQLDTYSWFPDVFSDYVMPKSDWSKTMEKLEFRHVDMFDLFLKFFEGIFSVNSILSYRLSRWVVEEKVMPIIATWFVIFRGYSFFPKSYSRREVQ